jgi:SNF2 family DNA or RNA helicase
LGVVMGLTFVTEECTAFDGRAALLSFVNPNVLGSLTSFKKETLNPIHKSRDRNATREEKQIGQVRCLLLCFYPSR